jgi:hypothetical protein
MRTAGICNLRGGPAFLAEGFKDAGIGGGHDGAGGIECYLRIYQWRRREIQRQGKAFHQIFRRGFKLHV